MPPSPPPVARPRRSEAGFTMIEVLVAAVLLIVGVLASLMLLDTGAASTASSLQRDTANAIAQEVIERASGLEYTKTRNDLTDVRTDDAAPTPADRLQRSMDPDGDQDSTAPTIAGDAPPTDLPSISTTTTPWKTRAQWTLRRGGTTYTVTYLACTQSDTVQGLQIMGPYDCDRGDVVTPSNPITDPSGKCTLSLFPTTDEPDSDLPAHEVTVRVLLLGALGLQACVGGTLEGLGLVALANPLCRLLGDGSGSVLDGVTGLADGILKTLASGLDLGLCPQTDVAHDLVDVTAGIASATKIETTVRWDGRNGGKTRQIVQDAVIRRPAS